MKKSEQIMLICSNPSCKKEYSVRKCIAFRSKTHFCCRQCYKEINKGIYKECPQCGKVFYVRKCRINETLYCSMFCEDQSKRTIKKCLYCESTFEGQSAQMKKRKFCSFTCSASYRSGPKSSNYKGNGAIPRICEWCGKHFTIPEAWLNRKRKKSGRFCSASCRSRHTVCKQGGMISSLEISVKEKLEMLHEIFYAQHRIGRFLVDFYLPQRNLVIECDGTYWHSLEKNKKNDLKKDEFLQKEKIHLERLQEPDIKKDCLSLLLSALEKHPKITPG